MANHEKDRKINPKLDAILPDGAPEAAELVGDIEDYQKRLEREWEVAKVAYESKINRIMDEFLTEGMADIKESAKNAPKTESSPHLKHLMADVEDELRRMQDKPQLPFSGFSKPTIARGTARPFFANTIKNETRGLAVGLFLLIAGMAYSYLNAVTTVRLPYTHTLGPIVVNNQVYIMDWFRKALYIHGDAMGLPILSVEFLPNDLATGFALSDKTVWSIDSFNAKILLHNTSPDHQVNNSVSTPETKPVGLFFDGTDLWSADQDSKKLYRHRGNDVEEIRDTYQLPDMTITAFAFQRNRLWVLDGKARLIRVFRLQKPMLEMGVYDLDPFLKGATPTGFTMKGRRVWLVTENPANLVTIPMFRLKHSKPEGY